jgi:isoamylase
LKPTFFSDSQWAYYQTQPLGAHVVTDMPTARTVFIAFSAYATRIELVLFSDEGSTEQHSIALEGPFNERFYACCEELAQPGRVYGYRVFGPTDLPAGHCYDPTRLLLDPAAKEVISLSTASQRVAANDRQPLARVPAALAQTRAATPYEPRLLRNRGQIVLYEVHIKGFTAQLPELPEAIRGTYSGMASDAAINHLISIGVNTVCLLPVQAHMTEAAIAQRDLPNYWGYNTIAFNFPDPRFATESNDPTLIRSEFRAMVRRLHAADIDVVLDVVYNHTAEAGIDGPILSFRGFDNVSWYRGAIDAESKQWRDLNDSGCGNTLNFSHPQVRQFVLDSLRYWVQEFEVDGFRFDLAPVMGRDPIQFNGFAPFFRELQADPLLSQVLLIAEPWDAGAGGYQLSEFPAPFLEWNDRYRDCMRRYWLGGAVTRAEFAARLAGSSDIFAENDRSPTASINFIAVHDGFTLLDSCTYTRKRNEANGENNRDGRDGELSRAFGAEQRAAVVRALLATLLLSQGTPMLAAGDEMGKTQNGNNNAYCQDNETSWLDWAKADVQTQALVTFVLLLRKQFALLRHPRWFAGHKGSAQEPALLWRSALGQFMTVQDWHDSAQQALAVIFDAGSSQMRFMLLANPAQTAQPFVIPIEPSRQSAWFVTLDTANQVMQWPVESVTQSQSVQAVGQQLICSAQSLMLLYQIPENS